MDKPEPERGDLNKRRTFGRWRQQGGSIKYMVNGRLRWGYDMPSRFDSATILDLIFQIQKKVWARPQDQADLLELLHYVLKPQELLCSGAMNGVGGGVALDRGDIGVEHCLFAELYC